MVYVYVYRYLAAFVSIIKKTNSCNNNTHYTYMVNVTIMQICTTLYTQHCYYDTRKHFRDKSRFLSRNTGANGNIKDTNLIERVHAVYYINYGAKHTEKA